MSQFELGKRSKENRKGVDPRLIEIDDIAIGITLVDYGHGQYAGVRLAEIQHELYLNGSSRCDGYLDFSKHQVEEGNQCGKALDFYAFVENKATWQCQYMAMIGAAFLQAASILRYPIRWGGLWKSPRSRIYGWDMGHIELVE